MCKSGQGGIRTRGTPFEIRRFSKPARVGDKRRGIRALRKMATLAGHLTGLKRACADWLAEAILTEDHLGRAA